MKTSFSILLVLLLVGCGSNNSTDIYVKSRDNVVKVQDKVVEILTEEPFISTYSDVHLLNDL